MPSFEYLNVHHKKPRKSTVEFDLAMAKLLDEDTFEPEDDFTKVKKLDLYTPKRRPSHPGKPYMKVFSDDDDDD